MPEQTTTGAFLGTIRYSAPEYLFGKPYDHTIDVYSLGCIASELYTNIRSYARHQHWADLIVAKAGRGFSGFDSFTFSSAALRPRLGARAAAFAAAVIAEATGPPDSRLSLPNLRSALAAHIWTRSFRVEKGQLIDSPMRHRDRFEMAERAASEVNRLWEPQERERLTELLVVHSGVDTPRSDEVEERLVSLGMLWIEEGSDFHERGPVVRVVSSVIEAFDLGLITIPATGPA
jgi:serine/threonine protein kinase